MTWEEKLVVLQSLAGAADVCLRMRAPGDWYVASTIDIGGDGLLRSLYGSGETPQEAVETTWIQATTLPPDRHLVVAFGTERQRRVRWSGYAWLDVGGRA